jgi:hypothetical protein
MPDIEPSNPELNALFNISTKNGVIHLKQRGTAEMLETILKKYNTEGVTVHTRNGLTWYPISSINEVDVEIKYV